MAEEDLKKVIMEKYLSWIKDNTFIKELKKGTIKIVSPFLDSHNDYLRLYINKIKDNELKIGDGSNLYFDLESYGFKWTNKKKDLFNSTLEAYGVQFNETNKEIFIKSDFNNIGRAKHRLIQSLVNLNDMFNLTQENIKELFFHDVYNHFFESNVVFNHNMQLRGMSGYEHKIDFAIGMSKSSPETLIKLVADPRLKQVAENCLFTFVDIERTNRKFKGIIIYKGQASQNFLVAFKEYSYDTYSWDNKKEITELLTS